MRIQQHKRYGTGRAMERSALSIIFAACVVLGTGATAGAADLLKVNATVWNNLTEPERATLQTSYIVDVATGTSYGVIVDAQAVNESTPGSTAGSPLGGALGSAMYVDKAFKAGMGFRYASIGPRAELELLSDEPSRSKPARRGRRQRNESARCAGLPLPLHDQDH